VNRPDKALRDPGKLKLIEIHAGAVKLGDLYVQSPRAHPPAWGNFFKGYIDLGALGHVSTSAAVLLTTARRRLFAITFGHGRHLLEPSACEERFGIRVVLNSIDEHGLRSIDKKTFDAISTHSRVQSSREAGAPDFGLDVELDLLRAATGTPKSEEFGKRLSGMDSLHAAVRVDVSNLRDLLSGYFDRFEDESYRKSFPWVDHIAEVSNKLTIAALDGSLVDGIRANSPRCWLAVPEIVDWASIKGFRYGSGSRKPEYHDLHLPDFLATAGDVSALTPEVLRKRYANAIDLSDHPLHRWSVYHCLYCELEHIGDSYLLTGGKWYRVSRDFVDTVNSYVRSLPRFSRSLPEYVDSSEADYCQRVANELPNQFALMDRKTIAIGGAYNKIEFCDLFTNRGDMIHIKRYAASSVLSHLFSQGVVSGEAFRSDRAFREAVNSHLPAAYRISSPERAPNPSVYQVVFAVVSDVPDDLSLPFFSRVNLKHAATRLQAYGYRTALAKIQVADRIAKTRRYRPK